MPRRASPPIRKCAALVPQRCAVPCARLTASDGTIGERRAAIGGESARAARRGRTEGDQEDGARGTMSGAALLCARVESSRLGSALESHCRRRNVGEQSRDEDGARHILKSAEQSRADARHRTR